MTTRTASCSCDRLKAQVTGEPKRVGICHCLACQRRTGSAFGVQARFEAAQVQVSGTPSEYVRVGDEGSHARFRFCAVCGATVYFTADEMPNVVAIPLGAFAGSALPEPSVSVYEERMLPWVGLPASIEHIA
ncbi:MAG: GFA family protein [Gammaproteobacteria bacterium]